MIAKPQRAQKLELALWVAGLLSLAAFPVEGGKSLCVYHHLGFTWCTGCGLGTSIHHFLRGSWDLGWSYHKFGLPALLILIFRIFVLIKHIRKNHGSV